MAQRSSSSRGGSATATRSRAISSATASAADIAQLTAEQIRGQLKKRGITGISAMRKDDLVKTLVKALRTDASTPTARKRTAQARTRGPAAAAQGTTPRTRKSVPAATRQRANTSRAGSGPVRRAVAAAGSAIRTGRTMSRSLRYAQQIMSPADRPERPGRSLVTTSHEVIRQWARARKAKPATISGTEREGRVGVLTFNFPGWREGGRLRQITWDEWFKTFDLRRLNFLYQEQRSDGRQSNFFRHESPDREDG